VLRLCAAGRKSFERGQAAPPDLRETQKPFVTARAEIKIFANKNWQPKNKSFFVA
jgi:hypothetical protein